MHGIARQENTTPRGFSIASITARLLHMGEYAPFALRRIIVLQALQRLFQPVITAGDFDFLHGRILSLCITDAEIEMYFSFNQGKFDLLSSAEPEVRIKGSTQAFLTLASGNQDPDSLFFQRKLMIEGDTELGLELKNTLDAIDVDSHPLLLRQLRQLLGRLMCTEA